MNNLVIEFYLSCTKEERGYLHEYAEKFGNKFFSICFRQDGTFFLKKISGEKVLQKIREKAPWKPGKPIIQESGDMIIPIIFA